MISKMNDPGWGADVSDIVSPSQYDLIQEEVQKALDVCFMSKIEGLPGVYKFPSFRAILIHKMAVMYKAYGTWTRVAQKMKIGIKTVGSWRTGWTVPKGYKQLLLVDTCYEQAIEVLRVKADNLELRKKGKYYMVDSDEVTPIVAKKIESHPYKNAKQ